MRLLDLSTDRPITGVLLMLTPEEAAELKDAVEDLLAQPELLHAHVSDSEEKHLVTVAVYTPRNLGRFSDKVQALIGADRE